MKSPPFQIKTYRFLATAFLGACVVFAVAALRAPPVLRLHLTPEASMLLRRGDRLLQWSWIAAALLLPAAAWTASRRAASGRPLVDSAPVLYVFMPFAWLPVACLPALMPDRLPLGIVSSVYLLACAPAAWVLLRAADAWMSTADEASARRDRRTAAGILVASTIAYAWMGNYLNARVGEHVGDEGHYLTQAQSLYEDGDLDLRNDIMEKAETKPPARDTRVFVHISAASRGDAWYSYHPYGLPLIMAPFWGLGRPFRQVLLALIAAAGNVAMFLLARRAGAGRKSATIAVAALGTSYYWAIYAVRALPETLGATLLAWAVWAVLAQRERRWGTVFLSAFCCVYLPVAHERFIPLALMAFGFYGLFGLFSSESWPAKIVRLGVFTVLCSIGFGLYIWSQFLLYEGGMKYDIGGGFMDFPLGMWGVVADSQGIVAVLPAFLWMAAALPVWLVRGRDTRDFAGMILALVAVCFIFSCPNRFYVGGSCVPGRYLLAIVPLLVPAAAFVYERTHGTGRGWLIYLSVLSACLLALVLPNLSAIGRGFILPAHNLKRALPLLSGMYHPHASYLYMRDATAQAATTVYVAGALGLTLAMLALPRRRAALAWAAIPLIAALGAAAHTLQPADWRSVSQSPAQVARRVGMAAREGMAIDLVGCDALEMESVLRVRFTDVVAGADRAGVTTRDLGVPRRGLMFSQPRMESNDWAGRGFRWATLTRPFTPEAGRMVLRVEGTLTGDASLVLAVREGSRTVFERPLDAGPDGAVAQTYSFVCRGGHGHLYILARLEEGEGAFALSDMHWMPWSTTRALIPGLTLDPETLDPDI